LLQKYDNKML